VFRLRLICERRVERGCVRCTSHYRTGTGPEPDGQTTVVSTVVGRKLTATRRRRLTEIQGTGEGQGQGTRDRTGRKTHGRRGALSTHRAPPTGASPAGAAARTLINVRFDLRFDLRGTVLTVRRTVSGTRPPTVHTAHATGKGGTGRDGRSGVVSASCVRLYRSQVSVCSHLPS
jgi:hypothetical protein